MATKTITIDLEAYRRLKSVQQENESFSHTIKRVVRKPLPADELAKLLEVAGEGLSDEFFKGVEDAIAWRQNPHDRERMNGLLGHDRRARSNGSSRSTKKGGRARKAKAA